MERKNKRKERYKKRCEFFWKFESHNTKFSRLFGFVNLMNYEKQERFFEHKKFRSIILSELNYGYFGEMYKKLAPFRIDGEFFNFQNIIFKIPVSNIMDTINSYILSNKKSLLDFLQIFLNIYANHINNIVLGLKLEFELNLNTKYLLIKNINNVYNNTMSKIKIISENYLDIKKEKEIVYFKELFLDLKKFLEDYKGIDIVVFFNEREQRLKEIIDFNSKIMESGEILLKSIRVFLKYIELLYKLPFFTIYDDAEYTEKRKKYTEYLENLEEVRRPLPLYYPTEFLYYPIKHTTDYILKNIESVCSGEEDDSKISEKFKSKFFEIDGYYFKSEFESIVMEKNDDREKNVYKKKTLSEMVNILKKKEESKFENIKVVNFHLFFLEFLKQKVKNESIFLEIINKDNVHIDFFFGLTAPNFFLTKNVLEKKQFEYPKEEELPIETKKFHDTPGPFQNRPINVYDIFIEKKKQILLSEYRDQILKYNITGFLCWITKKQLFKFRLSKGIAAIKDELEVGEYIEDVISRYENNISEEKKDNIFEKKVNVFYYLNKEEWYYFDGLTKFSIGSDFNKPVQKSGAIDFSNKEHFDIIKKNTKKIYMSKIEN